MRGSIGSVIPLVCVEHAQSRAQFFLTQRLRDTGRHMHVVIGVFERDVRHLNKLRAGPAQCILLLFSLRVREYNEGAVTQRPRSKRKPFRVSSFLIRVNPISNSLLLFTRGPGLRRLATSTLL